MKQKYPDSYGDVTGLAALGRAYRDKYRDSYGDVVDVQPPLSAANDPLGIMPPTVPDPPRLRPKTAS